MGERHEHFSASLIGDICWVARHTDIVTGVTGITGAALWPMPGGRVGVVSWDTEQGKGTR